MEALLIATLATSAADSVNPFAITQQFVLQGMVKKPWHIWFFILPTGIVNWIGAFLAVLFTFRLTFFQVIGILTLYNLVYMLPLMMLYGVYRFRAAQFTRLYAVFRKWAGRFSGWVSVLFSAVAGLGLLWLAIFR